MTRHKASALAFGLGLLLAAPAWAQSLAVAPSHLQVAREVVIGSGLNQTFESIYTEFRDNVRQLVGATRPEMVKDMNEVVALLKPESDKKRDEITAVAAEIYAKRMTEADLREVAAFFKSPAGQRYNAFRPQAMEEVFATLQPWSVATSNMLFDRFSAEMRKRGHQL